MQTSKRSRKYRKAKKAQSKRAKEIVWPKPGEEWGRVTKVLLMNDVLEIKE